MSKKKEPKKIRLETLSDVVNAITPENHVRLMKDFNLWLTLMLATKVVSGSMSQ